MKKITAMIVTLALSGLFLALPALAQDRAAEIQEAASTLASNPTEKNQLRLGTLHYLAGTDSLKAADPTGAVAHMGQAIAVLTEGDKVANNNSILQESRYGLAYAALQNGDHNIAASTLEDAVSADGNYFKARYLLGTVLMSSASSSDRMRGLDVMRTLAKEGEGSEKTAAANAATRFAYNLSVSYHAMGDAAKAQEILSATLADVGAGNAADGAENNAVAMATGVYLQAGGDQAGAMAAYQGLYDTNPGYATSGGTAVKTMLSNAQFQQGLNQLGSDDNQGALDSFTKAGQTGGKSADVHHGKAIAYHRLGDNEKLAAEVKSLVETDKDYYEKIKKAPAAQ